MAKHAPPTKSLPRSIRNLELTAPTQNLPRSVSPKFGKPKRPGPSCFECSKRNLTCDKVQPTCKSCGLSSRACNYPDSCAQCLSNNLEYDKSQTKCKVCFYRSIRCSYDTTTELGLEGEELASSSAGFSIDLKEQAMSTERNPPTSQAISEKKSTKEMRTAESPTRLSDLDIVLNKITGGTPVDPELYARIKTTFANNNNATLELSEIANNLIEDSIFDPTIENIISRLWSGHPELARELNQLVAKKSNIDVTAMGETGIGESDQELEDQTMGDEPLRYCFCNKENSGTMIACDNHEGPHRWFHLHCVNLLVTPEQGKSWVCSDNCRRTMAIMEQDYTAFERELDHSGVMLDAVVRFAGGKEG